MGGGWREIENTCDKTKLSQLHEIESWLGHSLPYCARLSLLNKGFKAKGTGPSKYTTLIFEPNSNGNVDVYDLGNKDNRFKRKQISLEGFNKVHGLLLFAQNLLHHPKFKPQKKSDGNPLGELRVEWLAKDPAINDRSHCHAISNKGSFTISTNKTSCLVIKNETDSLLENKVKQNLIQHLKLHHQKK